MIKFDKENVEFLEHLDSVLKGFIEPKEKRNLIHLFILNIEKIYKKYTGNSDIIDMWDGIDKFEYNMIKKSEKLLYEFLSDWSDQYIEKYEEFLSEMNEELLKIELLKYKPYENQKLLYDIVYSNSKMKEELTENFRNKLFKDIRKTYKALESFKKNNIKEIESWQKKVLKNEE
jgi:hypothetical protein